MQGLVLPLPLHGLLTPSDASGMDSREASLFIVNGRRKSGPEDPNDGLDPVNSKDPVSDFPGTPPSSEPIVPTPKRRKEGPIIRTKKRLRQTLRPKKEP